MKTYKAKIRDRIGPTGAWSLPMQTAVEVHQHDYEDESLVLIIDVPSVGLQVSLAFSREDTMEMRYPERPEIEALQERGLSEELEALKKKVAALVRWQDSAREQLDHLMGMYGDYDK